MLTVWGCLREGVDAVVRRFPLLFGGWLVILGVNQAVTVAVPPTWSWVSLVISLVLLAPLQAGFHLIALRAIRNEPTGFRDLFVGFSRWGTIVGASLLVSLLICLGILLFLLPGILWALTYAFVPIAVLDRSRGVGPRRRLGPIEAMRRSRELTEGYRGVLFGIGLLLILPTLAVVALSMVKTLLPEFPLPVWAIRVFLLLSGTLFLGPLQAASYMAVYNAVTGLEQPPDEPDEATGPAEPLPIDAR